MRPNLPCDFVCPDYQFTIICSLVSETFHLVSISTWSRLHAVNTSQPNEIPEIIKKFHNNSLPQLIFRLRIRPIKNRFDLFSLRNFSTSVIKTDFRLMKIVSMSYLMTFYVIWSSMSRSLLPGIKKHKTQWASVVFYKLQFQRQGHMLKFILFHLYFHCSFEAIVQC